MNELDEKISKLEISVRDRYADNPSTTERAFDKDYLAMLTQLREAYLTRNSPEIRDNLGWNTSDARRVKVYEGIMQKLKDEALAVAEYFCTDMDR